MSDPAGAIILLYHRIITLDRDPQLLCVSQAHFAAHLEILSRHYRVVPLNQLAAELRLGPLRPGTVAITFDDGYSDNLIEAAPVLRRFGMPATVFATTAHAADGREFFWDDLDRIFLSPCDLPPHGLIELEDGVFEIDLESASAYSLAEAAQHAGWTVLDPSDPTPRHRAYRGLCRLLHRSPASRRREWLDQLQAWSGVPPRTTHRMMTFAQMRELSANGLIDIGGHTTDHPALSAESPDVQNQQIAQNRSDLESALSHPPAAFSYPFGTRHDFTPQTTELVREAGYEFACANFAAQVTPASDLFRLPRFIIRGWPPEEFERKLQEWISAGGARR